MNEIWKQYPEHARYWVSNMGRVKSIYKYRPEKILKQSTNRKGYKIIKLANRSVSVHRLVALIFIPNPDNLPQVNHKDHSKDGNYVENLEWCTNEYNIDYSQAKEFTFVNPEGKTVSVRNLNKFCRDNDLPVGNMHRLHTGAHKIIKGWTCPRPS
jgi:NUMOD4 motif